MNPQELLDSLVTATTDTLWDLICNIPGGDDGDRGGLVVAVVAEILARGLALPDAAAVAEITNFRLAERKLAWRLVPVS